MFFKVILFACLIRRHLNVDQLVAAIDEEIGHSLSFVEFPSSGLNFELHLCEHSSSAMITANKFK